MLINLHAVLATLPSDQEKSDDVRFIECQVAAAVLVLEAAHIDRQNTEEELAMARKLIKDHLGKWAVEGGDILRLAANFLDVVIDDWIFTATVRNELPLTEKMEIIQMIWEVLYSGGNMSRLKDDWVHRIAREIGLDINDTEEARAVAFSKRTSGNIYSV